MAGKSFAFVAAAGVLAAITNQLIAWLRDRSGSRSKARHLALQLSSILDEFVDDTLDFRARIDDDIAQRYDFGSYSFEPAQLKVFPLDAEAWQALKPQLARNVYYFQRDVRWTYRQVVYNSQHMIPPEVAKEYSDAAVVVARDANTLALNLRLSYGFASDREVDAFFKKEDVGQVLAGAAEKVLARRALVVEQE